MGMRARSGILLTAILAAGLLVFAPAVGATTRGATARKIERIERHLRLDLKGILSQARAQLVQLTQLPSVQATNATACNADMAARAGNPRYTALGAADASGNVYCLSIPFTPPLGIPDRAYFLRALGTGDLGVGDYQVGRVTGQGAVGLGFPVRVGDGFNGIVLATLALAWLDPRVDAQRKKPATDLLVFDDHGTVLAYAGRSAIAFGTNLGSVALIKKGLRVDRSTGTTRFAGRKVFAAIDVVPLSGEGIHVAAMGRPKRAVSG